MLWRCIANRMLPQRQELLDRASLSAIGLGQG